MKLALLTTFTLLHSKQTLAQGVSAQLQACCAGKTTGPSVTDRSPGPGNGVQIDTSGWTTFTARITDNCGVSSVDFVVNSYEHPPTKASENCEVGYYCLDYTFPDAHELSWTVKATDVCGNSMETERLTFHGPEGQIVKDNEASPTAKVMTPQRPCCVGKTTGPAITNMYPGPGNGVQINTSDWTAFEAEVTDSCGVANVEFVVVAHEQPESQIPASCSPGHWCKDYKFPDDRDLKWYVEAEDICGNKVQSDELSFTGPNGVRGLRH